MKRLENNQKGAVTIIEAAFVFPIVFFIVFFMIMAGEAYYQRACVEYEVTAAAVRGAARCENPMLSTVMSSGVPTSPDSVDVMPYRYILTGESKKIASEVEGELESRIADIRPLLFKNMAPDNVSVSIKPKMNILISSFPVQCDFDVPFPIRMIFSDEKIKVSYSVSITTSIGDPSEFVRNVSTVSDIVERSEGLTNACSKIKSAMDKIGAYTN